MLQLLQQQMEQQAATMRDMAAQLRLLQQQSRESAQPSAAAASYEDVWDSL